MQLNVRNRSGIHIVEIAGRMMGGPETEQFGTTVKNLVAANKKQFLIDLSGVEWLNSSGLGALICSYVTVSKSGGRVAFCGLASARRLIEMTCLNEVLDLYDTADEAMAALLADELD